MTIRTHICLDCRATLPNTVTAVTHDQAGHQVEAVVLHHRTRGRGHQVEHQWSTDWTPAHTNHPSTTVTSIHNVVELPTREKSG